MLLYGMPPGSFSCIWPAWLASVSADGGPVLQVIDLHGLSPVNLITQTRNPESQAEWQHNMDYAPETLCKVPRSCLSSSAFIPYLTSRCHSAARAGI